MLRTQMPEGEVKANVNKYIVSKNGEIHCAAKSQLASLGKKATTVTQGCEAGR